MGRLRVQYGVVALWAILLFGILMLVPMDKSMLVAGICAAATVFLLALVGWRWHPDEQRYFAVATIGLSIGVCGVMYALHAYILLEDMNCEIIDAKVVSRMGEVPVTARYCDGVFMHVWDTNPLN